MHILVTNDDGIDSPGIWALAQALYETGIGTVGIVAPEHEQSGTSMAFPPQPEHTLRSVTVRPPEVSTAIEAYAHNGTPSGCVAAAMLSEVPARPDLVVSGINRGLNTGTNVLLSGTVGAAQIAALWGLPAMAVSLQFIGAAGMPWDTATWAVQRLLPLLLQIPKTVPQVLNVNVPHLHRIEDVRGFRQTTISSFFFGHHIRIEERHDDSDTVLRMRYGYQRSKVPTYTLDTDDGAIHAGYVSVTPLSPALQPGSARLQDELDRLA
jgi:5'-nucleotidase